ncbi:SDR family NAD(P)-dependent oxidoreductase [Micromonospora sp. NPDC126480]|uniref:type I polyketide synthase n=1 Tax=Micromonospora sp. NPDC126480 TaxID=3155312 RepID=UPI00332B4009
MSDLFEPIAIVGMAARLPGARDVHEYWNNLIAGRDCISSLSDDELLSAGATLQQIADPSYVKRAGLVPGFDEFDPDFFRMTPREAAVCDPQQRLFLELTYEAIENAGYHPSTLGHEVAVYGASAPARYGDYNVLTNPEYNLGADIFGLAVLNNIDYLATLASYKFDFRGPSMAVLTACSSSLATILMGCRSLHVGECDVAIAGAVHAVIPYHVGYRWSPGDVRSPDGVVRAFDAGATGTLFSSGAGAVMLKRLGDSIADGDHILGVIRGIGANNDGSDKVSFSAPSMRGVTNAVVDGMALSGFGPADIDCVEMHATGTPIGDPIEVKALAAAYSRLDGRLADGAIPVGSVKSNIGHGAAAAGMAGLLKLLLALKNEQLPPTINVARANPRLEIERSPLRVNDTINPWPRTTNRVRRAGLTSLGIGGTNFHLVLEEGPAPAHTPHLNRPRIVVWSGRDAAARAANRAALADYFAAGRDDEFASAVATLQHSRGEFALRGAAICTDPRDAARQLSADGKVLTGEVSGDEPPGVLFTFPGQAAQHVRMAAGLVGSHRVFTETVDTCLEVLDRHGLDLYPLWQDEQPGDALYETANAQPLLFTIEYALARQWSDWGIRPAGLLGHSVGELVAATVAGVFELEDALRLVAARGQVMQAQPRGSMLVVAATPDRVRDLLGDDPAVTVAAVNAAEQVVVAGPDEAVTAAAALFAEAGVATQPLRTSHAFHSPAMAPAVDEFLAVFEGVRLHPPAIPVFSAVTGRRLSDDEAVDPAFWARQIAEPVLFADAVGAAVAGTEGRFVLEVGPGRTLSGLVQRHPAVAGAWRVLASLPRPGRQPDPRYEERTILDGLAELWLSGAPVDWPRVYRDEAPQRVPLPGYRFQRARYWVDPAPAAAAAPVAATPASPPEQPGPAEIGPFAVPGWVETPPPAGRTRPTGTTLALVPADPASATPYVAALQQAGHRVVRVRPGTARDERAGAFVVRPRHLADDLAWVLDRLTASGRAPATLVHAWGAGPLAADRDAVDDELDLTVFALLDLVRTAAREPVDGRLPELIVLTSGAVDVSGGEPLIPCRAALVAAARTYAMETAGAGCRVIDTGPVRAEDMLVAELLSGAPDRLVALRGSRRWTPVQRPWPGTDDEPAIRRGGVYLITGGLGGLGLAVAKGLAATGRRPRLALLARTVRDVADDLAEIEAMGAQATVVAADVADGPQLRKALDEVAETLGPISGVLHLAGLAGGGMLQMRDRADAADVLRPKVHGTLALAAALAGHPPIDFVVCFSSRAALTGMIGNGDYAAANAFLDAFCAGQPGWRSIDWPPWTTVGMAAGGVVDRLTDRLRAATSAAASVLTHETVVAAATHWELDEHRIKDAAVMPGTGTLDLVLRALPELVPELAGPVTLTDVMFLRPLVADAPRRLRTTVEPDGDRAWRVRVHVRGADVDEYEHTSFRITPADKPAPVADVAELPAGMAETTPPTMLPEPGATMVFGPRWRCVRRLWESADTIVAELELSEPFRGEAAGRAVHPSLVDVGTGLLRRRRPDELVLPFHYERMTWWSPVPGRVFCRLRQRPGTDLVADVQLVADDGTVVTEVVGFRLRPPVVDPASDPASAPAEVPSGEGLSPDDGVRLLLRLLAAGGPAQVAVLPHRDGRPVPPDEPLVSAVAAPTAPAAEPVEAAVATVAATDGGAVQDRLAELWTQVLGRTGISPEDDFFALGGDSLMGVGLVGRIRDTFAIEVSIGALFESPTLGELAAVLVRQGAR